MKIAPATHLHPGCVVADQPKHDAQGQSGSGKGCDHTRRGLVEIENDESANQCKQRDQHYGSYLDDGAAMMLDHQQRVLEFESNQHRKHHAKQALKDLRVSRVDHMAFDQPYCVQQQLPSRERYDDGYYKRE